MRLDESAKADSIAMRVTKNSGEQYENTDGPDIAQPTGEHWRPTGFWLKEFAALYFVFKSAGIELTLASPKGGQPPLRSEKRSA